MNIAEENRGVLKVVHRRGFEGKNKCGNYYPFGMQWDTPKFDFNDNSLEQTGAKTKYTYNGKELLDDLDINLHDYGFRYYDPAIGRWTTIDPRAEKYPDMSSYNYVGNNPISNIDIKGDTITPVGFETDNVAMTQDRSAAPQFLDPSVPDFKRGGLFLIDPNKSANPEGQLEDGEAVETVESPGTIKYSGTTAGSNQQYENAEGYLDGKVVSGVSIPEVGGSDGAETGRMVTPIVATTGDSASYYYESDGKIVDTNNVKFIKPASIFGGQTEIIYLPKSETVKSPKR